METDYRTNITAGILAGGESRRMQGQDKGLVKLLGKPLIQYCIDIIRPQVDGIIINTNRNNGDYTSFGYPLVADAYTGYQGPLAGIAACMAACSTDMLVCIPCDSPVLPDDLVARLYTCLHDKNADICFAHAGGRTQPLFVLLKTSLLNSVQAYLEGGGRKPDNWYQRHIAVESDFAAKDHLFININDNEDLAKAETMLLNN